MVVSTCLFIKTPNGCTGERHVAACLFKGPAIRFISFQFIQTQLSKRHLCSRKIFTIAFILFGTFKFSYLQFSQVFCLQINMESMPKINRFVYIFLEMKISIFLEFFLKRMSTGVHCI